MSADVDRDRGFTFPAGETPAMTDDGTRKATSDELAEVFVDVRAGDRLQLTYETPDGEERTARAEAATDAQVTERSRDEPAAGNVAFWYRDLDRVEDDEADVPFATVRYRPHGRDPPVVRVHGHTPTPGTTAGIEYLGDVVRAVVDARGGEEAQNA